MFNEEEMKGKWNEIRSEIKTQWGKMTDNELDQAEGNLGSIAGLIQQRYGAKKEEIQAKLQSIASKFVKKTDDIKREMRQ